MYMACIYEFAKCTCVCIDMLSEPTENAFVRLRFAVSIYMHACMHVTCMSITYNYLIESSCFMNIKWTVCLQLAST